jgi:hypothetical protein
MAQGVSNIEILFIYLLKVNHYVAAGNNATELQHSLENKCELICKATRILSSCFGLQ